MRSKIIIRIEYVAAINNQILILTFAFAAFYNWCDINSFIFQISRWIWLSYLYFELWKYNVLRIMKCILFLETEFVEWKNKQSTNLERGPSVVSSHLVDCLIRNCASFSKFSSLLKFILYDSNKKVKFKMF